MMINTWIEYIDLEIENNLLKIDSVIFKTEGYYELILKNGTQVRIYFSDNYEKIADFLIWNELRGLPVEDLSYLFNDFVFNNKNRILVNKILDVLFHRGWTLEKKILFNRPIILNVYYGTGFEKEKKLAFRNYLIRINSTIFASLISLVLIFLFSFKVKSQVDEIIA